MWERGQEKPASGKGLQDLWLDQSPPETGGGQYPEDVNSHISLSLTYVRLSKEP